ncbi:MAG: hypothetical protein IPO59_19880, partial [Betaproteobacteria bacterium]|nr:hypothetical protein [Betaproteobacteria bacterium]
MPVRTNCRSAGSKSSVRAMNQLRQLKARAKAAKVGVEEVAGAGAARIFALLVHA